MVSIIGVILIALLVLLVLAGLVVGVVLLVVWLMQRGKPSPPVIPAGRGATKPPEALGSCPRCGAVLPADAPQGLCPRCVLGVGLATHTEAPGEAGPHGTKVTQPPLAPAEIASHFPQLEILECLGRGGMGVVYKARQPKLNRLVALKILAPEKGADPRFAERFLREAQALARLSHPNIVTVHDFGEADGLYYLLMEYVDGVTLRQLLQARKIVPEEALGIVPKICEALQFAHEQGVVHRDIKPENVLLDKQGRVKIADFGIAKLVGGTPLTPSLSPSDGEKVPGRTGEGALTQEQVLGTPHYMAPEQMETPQLVDHRADIYSLGVVFYEMLTGELPLGKFQPPSKKVQLDVRLDEVVMHALEKEPERRYQHASEVKTAVDTIASTPGGQAQETASVGVPRFSRMAIWGAEWAPLFFIAAVLFIMPIRVSVAPGNPVPGSAWWQVLLSLTLLPLGLTAPFGTTVFGWIAIAQIRHSRGQLYGLGLAVFDALLFPLLALNGLIVWGWNFAADELADALIPHLGRAVFTTLMLTVLVVSCVTVSWLIIWAVWRAANREPRSGQAGSAAAASAPSPGSAWRVVGIVAATMLVLAVLAGALSLAIYRSSDSKRQRVASYDPSRVGAVEQKLTRTVGERLRAADYAFDHLFVNIRNAKYNFAECQLKGLRKPVGEGLQNGSPVQLFDALSGGLDIRHTGNGLWAVQGSGDLTNISFTVDASVEMGPRSAMPSGTEPHLYLEPEENDSVPSPVQDRAKSAQTPRSLFPKGAHIGRNNYSVMLYHDDEDLHYALFYAGDFSSSSRGSHNTRSKAWTDDGTLTLKNGRTFGYLRESPDPDHLRINGREFDLRQGRVFTLRDDGTVTQLALFPSLAIAPDPEQLAGLIASAREPAQTSGKTLQLEDLSEAERTRALAIFNDIEDSGHEFDAAFSARNLTAAQTGTRRLLTLLTNFNAAVKGTDYEFPPGIFDDIGKIRQALDEGDWDKIRRAARHNEEYARVFKRTGSRMVELARQQNQGAATTFGPVSEVTLTEFNNMDGQEALDLDASKVCRQPRDMDKWSEAGLTQWVTQNGIDLLVDEGPGGRWGLLTTLRAELQLAQVKNEKWPDISRPELLHALTNSPLPLETIERGSLKVVMLPKDAQPPPTFAFRTSTGGMGLLQITGFTDRPRGVKIRYKLLKSH